MPGAPCRYRSLTRAGTMTGGIGPDVGEPGRWLKSTHDDMMENWRRAKAPIPQNVRDKRGLDCAVLNWVYTQSDAAPTQIETCRGVFVPRVDARWLRGADALRRFRRDRSALASVSR